MRAEQDADALEAPGDHGPAAGDVNPFFAGVAAEERRERESEWHRKAGVPEIEHRRMNHHFGILQQRIQAAAFGDSREVHDARAIGAGDYLKGRGDEIIEREEKGLDASEDDSCVRHQLGMPFAIEEKDEERVTGQKPCPEKQRTFLAGPERCELVVRRERGVAVLSYVCQRKIIGEKEVFEAPDSDGDQNEYGHACVAGAFRQQNAARDDADDSSDDGVHRRQKGEQQC